MHEKNLLKFDEKLFSGEHETLEISRFVNIEVVIDLRGYFVFLTL